jgi:hypothetical protein
MRKTFVLHTCTCTCTCLIYIYIQNELHVEVDLRKGRGRDPSKPQNDPIGLTKAYLPRFVRRGLLCCPKSLCCVSACQPFCCEVWILCYESCNISLQNTWPNKHARDTELWIWLGGVIQWFGKLKFSTVSLYVYSSNNILV